MTYPIFFWGKSMKIRLQSTPFSLKQLLVSPFAQTLFAEYKSHCSYFSEQYIGLNCICSENNDNLASKTNLALLYQSSFPCRVHTIDESMPYWYPRFWFFGHTIFKQPSFRHFLSNVIGKMLRNSCVKFCGSLSSG